MTLHWKAMFPDKTLKPASISVPVGNVIATGVDGDASLVKTPANSSAVVANPLESFAVGAPIT
jgi:hypothetical protein